jgi:hypothetical protein
LFVFYIFRFNHCNRIFYRAKIAKIYYIIIELYFVPLQKYMNMNINVLTKEPEILTDKKGNSFRLIPEEDLKKIAISKEQSKLGLTSKSKDVF